MKKWLKNQKGLTLVELLAVIVILGIIAAIAVPAIGNIIENSRKDAQIANAEALYDAARLMQTGENVTGEATFYVSLDNNSEDQNSEDQNSEDQNSEDQNLEDYIDAAFAESDPHSAKYTKAEVKYTEQGDYLITLTGTGAVSYFEETNITHIREHGRNGFPDDGSLEYTHRDAG